MAQSETSKPKPQKYRKTMLVRYGRMGYLGWFEHNENEIPKTANRVVIKTDRGLELGEIVGKFNYKGGHFKSSPEQVENYFCNRTKDYPLGAGGTFVRFATHEDLMEEKHLEISAKEEQKCCEKFIEEMELPMKIVDTEHVFGGERIIIYFSSNGRVDFRELVRKLAKEYQTRIELRQIGSRDEAKLVSDYESCGQECCCRRFLKILEPVNMRMAKLQKATLDPSKISGHCGRLKCCLRYEDSTYKDLKQRLPKKNTLVKTPHGEGTVVDGQILTQLVEVMYESGEKEAWPLDEIEIIGKGQEKATSEEPIEEINKQEEEIPEDIKKEEPIPEEEQEEVTEEAEAEEKDLGEMEEKSVPNQQGGNKKRKRGRRGRGRRRKNRSNNKTNGGNGRQGQAGKD
jgi:cell fate regulator YaaT (PSP1 superfamily)